MESKVKGHRPVRALLIPLMAVILMVSFVAMLGGCSSVKEISGQRDPKELYDLGMASYVAQKYEDAEKYFKALMENHPLSAYSVDAQLLLGDVYYSMENYDDAGSYYTNFIALHPMHPKAAYALFQKGMCHFRDVLSLDRDQTSTRKALFAFQDLITNYPDSAYIGKARELIGFLKRRLADREFYIARFYFKSKNYKGALGRFRNILKDYPEVGLTDQTLYYVIESYVKLGEKKLAEETYATLLSNFPQSPFIRDAGNKLKSI